MIEYDIYGNPLTPGHCEVHPHVDEPYPCYKCQYEEEMYRSMKQSEEADTHER